MTSEIESAAAPFIVKVVERNYSTPPGWRLATVEEAKYNLDMIRHLGWELTWERARLLDGWISGSTDNFQIGDDFTMFMGHMLVIRIQGDYVRTMSIYSDVPLSPKGKEVALLLCAYDWNYEVVYWLLNSWESRYPLNLWDVREGKIPLRDTARFLEMNRMICCLCGILGKEGRVDQIMRTRKPSEDSVREVMASLANSCWNKISQENHKILPTEDFQEKMNSYIQYTIDHCSEANLFLVSESETSEGSWTLMWNYILYTSLLRIVRSNLSVVMEDLKSEERQVGSPSNLTLSTTIIYCLIEYKEYLLKRNVEQASKDVADDDRQRLYEVLGNTSSVHCDENGDYNVLERVLISAMRLQNCFLMSKVLEWGAQPETRLSGDFLTALFDAVKHNATEILKIIFEKCKSAKQVVNSQGNDGQTALHVACCHGDVSTIRMILHYGGNQYLRDKKGSLAIHYAAAFGSKETMRTLVNSCDQEQLINAIDGGGMTALHLACLNADVGIVEMILQYGGKQDVPDKEGSLPLHYAVQDRKERIVRILLTNKPYSVKEFIDIPNYAGMTALHLACRNAHVGLVEMILQHGGKQDVRDKEGSLPFHYAVQDRNERIVRILLTNKSYLVKGFIDIPNYAGMTALHLACRNAHVGIVEMILQYGGKQDVRDKEGSLPLHYAVQNRNERIVRILLTNKSYSVKGFINIPNYARMTALHLACRNADVGIVEMILQYGGKQDVWDKEGSLPLHYAVQDRNERIVRILLTNKSYSVKGFIDIPNSAGMTALHLACRNADVGIVEMILQCGGNPDVEDKERRLPHHYAAASGKKEIVLSLFEKCYSKELSANATDGTGKTPLHVACRDTDDANIVEMILEFGGKPNVPDTSGCLPLHYAVLNRKRDNVRSLLDKSHSIEKFINVPDYEGMTALHLACRNSDVSTVEMILQYGGKQDVQDKRGSLPLHYAVQDIRNEDIVRTLLDKSDSIEQFINFTDYAGKTALHLACHNADVGIVEMILEHGGKADVRDKEGRLPHHHAAASGRKEIMRSLFEKCDSKEQLANAADNAGKTALHVACHAIDDVSIVEMMIQYGGKLDVRDREGCCPLHYAIQRCGKGYSNIEQNQLDSANTHSKIVERLLEEGADPRVCDKWGRTALHYSAMVEDEDRAIQLSKLMLARCTREEDKIWVEQKDILGETPLHVAGIKGYIRLCEEFRLINENILTLKDADGRGFLHVVIGRCKHDNPQVISLLSREVKVDSIKDHSDLTLLHVAASAGRKSIADALIQMSGDREAKVKYLRTPDIPGQTALHKAAKEGHVDTVTVLLHHGADPLLERDSDGRTALHCAVQNQAENQTEDKVKAQEAVAELLLKKCGSDEKKLLLLWASAAGLGTADEIDSPLKEFVRRQKNSITEKLGGDKINLLRMAARVGDTDMTKELVTRGAEIGDIKDKGWMERLPKRERDNVNKVCKQIQILAQQGNDKPATSDNLGRSHLAEGLAALLLNPYLKPPITVGISGSWGMGKSSLMVQTEAILLKTAAQLALLPSQPTMSSFPGIRLFELSKKGKKKHQEIRKIVGMIQKEKESEKKLFLAFRHNISQFWMNITTKRKPTDRKKGDSLSKFLNEYEADHHRIFQSLAAMDCSYMFKPKDQRSTSEINSTREESVPAILTVRYNAWKYMNESEALAGIAVEITKAMEGIMTDAQWLSTCLRNTWRKQKHFIWIQIIFPCILVVLLAISLTLVLWFLLDRYNIKESVEIKYASLPITVVTMVWTLAKKVMSAVNPVSAQLMNYMKLPDHREKLGYQDRVIDDINFVKEEISKRPYFPCTVAFNIWHFVISLLPSKYCREFLANSIPSANLRTIVFVDDIDRCQDSVILQVLSAINLVLASCQISVVLGMDKDLIQRAIMNRYENMSSSQQAMMETRGDISLSNCKQLADKYLQKIIQVPLDLPEPSHAQTKEFLYRHLGVFQERKESCSKIEIIIEDGSKQEIEADVEDVSKPELESVEDVSKAQIEIDVDDVSKPEIEADVEDVSASEIDVAYYALFPDMIPNPAETREPRPRRKTTGGKDNELDSGEPKEIYDNNSRHMCPNQTLWQRVVAGCINHFKACSPEKNLVAEDSQETNVAEGDPSLNYAVRIRQMLFMTYSKGEQNVFEYFEEMATDIRKLPREWKRLLNYHRLVWSIFLINNEAKHLDGWQKWDNLRALNEDNPSLRMIVDQFIKNESWLIPDDTTTALETSRNKDTTPEDMERDKKGKAVSMNKEDPGSSSSSKLEVAHGQMIEEEEPEEDVSNAGFLKGTNQLDALKEESKEHVSNAGFLKGRNELYALKTETDEIKMLLAELKEQVSSILNQQQVLANEKTAKEKKLKSESWGRLQFALQRYDVSMKGIQTFQSFRFYCVPRHLPWPVPPRMFADIKWK